MSRTLIAASAFALTLGVLAPAAVAQDAPAAAPGAGSVETAAPMTEAEFEALAEAFGARMEGMSAEMQTAITEAAGDAAKQDASLDAIQARYQTDADGFASALEAFLNQQAAAAGADEGGAAMREQMATVVATALPQIRSIPQQVRTQAERAAVAAAAAPAETPAS